MRLSIVLLLHCLLIVACDEPLIKKKETTIKEITVIDDLKDTAMSSSIADTLELPSNSENEIKSKEEFEKYYGSLHRMAFFSSQHDFNTGKLMRKSLYFHVDSFLRRSINPNRSYESNDYIFLYTANTCMLKGVVRFNSFHSALLTDSISGDSVRFDFFKNGLRVSDSGIGNKYCENKYSLTGFYEIDKIKPAIDNLTSNSSEWISALPVQ